MGYRNKIKIDYEGLPRWVVREIERRFDNGGMGSNKDFLKWQSDLVSFIKTVPTENKVLFIEKGIEFAKKALTYHIEFDCNHPNDCSDNESWERRIPLAEELLETIQPSKIENTTTSNIKFAGSKIDLIRILNALYELKRIENLNGQVPTKKEFMTAAGYFFNINLSDYDTSLSQAIKEGDLEPNLEIFEKMKTNIQNIWHEKH